MKDLRGYSIRSYKPNNAPMNRLFTFAIDDYKGYLGDIYKENEARIDGSYVYGAILEESDTMESIRSFIDMAERANGCIIVFGYDEKLTSGKCKSILNDIDTFLAEKLNISYTELEDVYEDRVVYVRDAKNYQHLNISGLTLNASSTLE